MQGLSQTHDARTLSAPKDTSGAMISRLSDVCALRAPITKSSSDGSIPSTKPLDMQRKRAKSAHLKTTPLRRCSGQALLERRQGHDTQIFAVRT